MNQPYVVEWHDVIDHMRRSDNCLYFVKDDCGNDADYDEQQKNASVKVSGFADLRLLTVRRFFVLLISSLPFILRCFDNEKASVTNISFCRSFQKQQICFSHYTKQ